MTMPALINTGRSLSYYNTLQDIAANNLANANSDGYKADHVTAHSNGSMNPTPVQSIDLGQADLRDTNRQLDIGLQGPGFTVVQTSNGERLTRGGSMEVSKDGILVDRHGNAVLGVDGPIKIAGTKVEIDPDGTVIVDGGRAGRLRLATVADPKTLLKEGSGMFVANTPLVPAEDAAVHQGAVEESNVSSLLGSVDLIMIQRAYASSVDAMKVMDGVLQVVANDIGRV